MTLSLENILLTTSSIYLIHVYQILSSYIVRNPCLLQNMIYM